MSGKLAGGSVRFNVYFTALGLVQQGVLACLNVTEKERKGVNRTVADR